MLIPGPRTSIILLLPRPLEGRIHEASPASTFGRRVGGPPGLRIARQALFVAIYFGWLKE
jgi:hypothetical protein